MEARRSVIPNRGATAHKGAVRRCLGYRLFSKIQVKLEVTKVPPAIVLDAYGCRQIFLSLKGCREPKKVGKHCRRCFQGWKEL